MLHNEECAGARVPVSPGSELGSSLHCGLCKGYLIDATTITDCLHSFCRSCVVQYLTSHNVCPQCHTKVSRGRHSLRRDHILQDLVYKLVPGLFTREMEKRLQFAKALQSDQVTGTDQGESSDCGDKLTNTPSVSVCLELTDSDPSLQLGNSKPVDLRYLLCPEAASIKVIKKFISLKFQLPLYHEVRCYYRGQRLPETFTLGDVILLYGWTKMSPLKVCYTVFDPVAMILNRPRTAKQGVRAIFSDLSKDGTNTDEQTDLPDLPGHEVVGENCDIGLLTPTSDDSKVDNFEFVNSPLDTRSSLSSPVRTPDNKSSLQLQFVDSPEYKVTSVSNIDAVDSSLTLPAPKLVIKCKKRGRPRKNDSLSPPAAKVSKQAVCKLTENGKMKLIISSAAGNSLLLKRKAYDGLDSSKFSTMPRKLPKLLPKPSPAESSASDGKLRYSSASYSQSNSSSLTNSNITSDVSPARKLTNPASVNLFEKPLFLNIDGRDLAALTPNTAVTSSDHCTLQKSAVSVNVHSPSAMTNCKYSSPLTTAYNNSIMNIKTLQSTSFTKYKDITNNKTTKSMTKSTSSREIATHGSGQSCLHTTNRSPPIIICSPNKIKTDVTKTLFEKLIDEFSPKKAENTSHTTNRVVLGSENDKKKALEKLGADGLCKKSSDSGNKLGVSVCHSKVNEAFKADCQKGKLHLKKANQGLGVKYKERGSNEGVKKTPHGTTGVYDFDRQSSDDNDIEGITVFNVAKSNLVMKSSKSNVLSGIVSKQGRNTEENNTGDEMQDNSLNFVIYNKNVPSDIIESLNCKSFEKSNEKEKKKPSPTKLLEISNNDKATNIAGISNRSEENSTLVQNATHQTETVINVKCTKQRVDNSPIGDTACVISSLCDSSNTPSSQAPQQTTGQIPLKINVRWDSKEGIYVRKDQSLPQNEPDEGLLMKDEKTGKKGQTELSSNNNKNNIIVQEASWDSDLESLVDNEDALVIDESAQDNDTWDSQSIQPSSSAQNNNDDEDVVIKQSQPLHEHDNSHIRNQTSELHDNNGDNNGDIKEIPTEVSFKKGHVDASDRINTEEISHFSSNDNDKQGCCNEGTGVLTNSHTKGSGQKGDKLPDSDTQLQTESSSVVQGDKSANVICPTEHISNDVAIDRNYNNCENKDKNCVKSDNSLTSNNVRHYKRSKSCIPSLVSQTDSPPHAKIKRIVHPDGSGQSNLKVVFSLIPKQPKVGSLCDTPKGIPSSKQPRTCLSKTAAFKEKTESNIDVHVIQEQNGTEAHNSHEKLKLGGEFVNKISDSSSVKCDDASTGNNSELRGREVTSEKDNSLTLTTDKTVAISIATIKPSPVILKTPTVSSPVRAASDNHSNTPVKLAENSDLAVSSNKLSSSKEASLDIDRSPVSFKTPVSSENTESQSRKSPVAKRSGFYMPSCPSVTATPLGMFASPRAASVCTPGDPHTPETPSGGENYDVPLVIGTKSFLSLHKISNFHKESQNLQKKLNEALVKNSESKYIKGITKIKHNKSIPDVLATNSMTSILATNSMASEVTVNMLEKQANNEATTKQALLSAKDNNSSGNKNNVELTVPLVSKSPDVKSSEDSCSLSVNTQVKDNNSLLYGGDISASKCVDSVIVDKQPKTSSQKPQDLKQTVVDIGNKITDTVLKNKGLSDINANSTKVSVKEDIGSKFTNSQTVTVKTEKPEKCEKSDGLVGVNAQRIKTEKMPVFKSEKKDISSSFLPKPTRTPHENFHKRTAELAKMHMVTSHHHSALPSSTITPLMSSPAMTPLIPSPAFFSGPYFPLAAPPFSSPFIHPMLPLLPLHGLLDRSPDDLFFSRSPMYDRSHVQDYYDSLSAGMYPHTPETPLACRSDVPVSCRSDTPIDYSKHGGDYSKNSGSKLYPGVSRVSPLTPSTGREDGIITIDKNSSKEKTKIVVKDINKCINYGPSTSK